MAERRHLTASDGITLAERWRFEPPDDEWFRFYFRPRLVVAKKSGVLGSFVWAAWGDRQVWLDVWTGKVVESGRFESDFSLDCSSDWDVITVESVEVAAGS